MEPPVLISDGNGASHFLPDYEKTWYTVSEDEGETFREPVEDHRNFTKYSMGMERMRDRPGPRYPDESRTSGSTDLAGHGESS